MKRNDLIELLKTLPEDAEIATVEGDDILGDYAFNTHLTLTETEGYKTEKGAIYLRYSNYCNLKDEKVTVWEIR